MATTRENIIDPTTRETIIAAIKAGLDGTEEFPAVQSLVKDACTNLDQDKFGEITEDDIRLIALVLIGPELLVDWGDHPRMGHRANPCFQILCPGFNSTPRISADIDRHLDHDPPNIFPQSKEEGLFEFFLPFRLTTNDEDCRPGLYTIRLDLWFPDSPSTVIPRFYHCDIRLNIKSMVPGQEPVLEIDGDGQSVIDLEGFDLTQYSKVKLKAGDGAVITSTEKVTLPSHEEPAPAPEKAVTFKYELKVNRNMESRSLHVSSQFARRPHLEKVMIVDDEEDRQIILVAKRVTLFGRNTQNDVVVRFLPRNESNDDLSRDISRKHMMLEINSQGLLIHDSSTKGIALGLHVVEKTHLLTTDEVDDELPLCFGTDFLANRFEFELQLFGPERNPHAQRDLLRKDDLFADDSGQRFDRAGQLARNCEINAARLRRTSNLSEEEYVLVYRHVYIGSSRTESAVTIYDHTLKPRHARIVYLSNTFWLENLQNHGAVQVNGEPIAPREMVPLEPGMEIQLGEKIVRFESAKQKELEN